MTTISDLRLRVEKASGPDRELDVDIALWLWVPTADYDRVRKPIVSDFGLGTYEEVGFSGFHVRQAEFYTASLDAVVALIERVMPEGNPIVWRTGRTWFSEIRAAAELALGGRKAAQTAPLALLAAFLAALEAKESSNARD